MKKPLKKSTKPDRAKELEEMLKRVQADFINYKKRTEAEKDGMIKFAFANSLTKIIPVVDNFNRAFAHLPAEMEGNEWVLGIKQIEKQLEDILEQVGLKKIETKDVIFDPAKHEAISFQENKKLEDGKILQELEIGYELDGKIIRPAKVIVVKNN